MGIKPKVLEVQLLTYLQCPYRGLKTWSENRNVVPYTSGNFAKMTHILAICIGQVYK